MKIVRGKLGKDKGRMNRRVGKYEGWRTYRETANSATD